jgi:hypothetical protein
LAINPVRMIAILQLDLDVDAGRQIELHQRIHRLRRRLDDIQQAAMGADFELLTAFLVDMRRAIDGEALDLGGQRNRAAHACAGTLRGAHDLLGAVVQQPVIIRLEAYADVLIIHLRVRDQSCLRKG